MQNSNELSPIATNDLAVVTGGIHDPDPTSPPCGGAVAGAAVGAIAGLLATAAVPQLPPVTDAARASRAHVPV